MYLLVPYPDVKTSKTSGIIPWNPDYLYLIQPNGDTQKFMRIRDCSNNSTFVPVLSGESVESKVIVEFPYAENVHNISNS